MDLSLFNTANLFDAATDLFKQLGIKTNSTTGEPLPIGSILKNQLKSSDAFKAINNTFFIGLIDDELIESSTGLFDLKISYQEAEEKIHNEYKGIMVFAVDIIHDKKPTANQFREITRAFNRMSSQIPVVVIFKTGSTISFSNCERVKYQQVWKKGEKVGKVSVLYDVDTTKPHQGHIRILESLAIEEIKKYDKRNKVESFNDLHRAWVNVFNTDVLNRQFYLDYQKLSVKLINAIYPEQIENKLLAHQGILNLLNRIMFIYFVQKKEWIMNDEDFIIHFWKDYQATGKRNVFHQEWLNSVFFSAFNGIAYKDPKAIKTLPEPYKTEIIKFPFLNGGLFSYHDDYDKFLLSDTFFDNIFEFFEGYIFTISEDTPYDVNLEINPELLGKMYEGMINATDLDDVDAENGIIYTERSEINFMTRRSFVEVLDKKLNGTISREFLYHFIFDEPEQKLEILKHYKPNIEKIRSAITTITACDSACGSGSMILGVIQLQMELLRTIDAYSGNPHSEREDFLLKKQLISECLYGVDIKEWAVRIAELRLWLYMIAEANFSKEELVKTPLLPNLDFKLRMGNSLIQKVGSLNFSIEDLFKGRNKSIGAAKKLNDFIKKKKAFIINQSESDTTYVKLKAEEYSVFNIFIEELINENDIKLKNLGKREKQISMFAEPEQQEIDIYATEKEELKQEIEKLKRLKDTIHKEKRLPFSYDIDFMEIFLTKEDSGFDLIIGNPPYVRQEQILPPEDGEYLEFLLLPENKDEKAKINKDYKEILNEKVYKTYPFLNTKVKTIIDGKNKTIPVYGNKVPGRSDLYCYFQLLCPSYLNSNGTFCYIISNSWLDVEFGSFIQHFFLKHTELYAIYDSNIRSFEAKVNTIIYLHSSLKNISEKSEKYFKTLVPIDNKVRFIMNKVDYNQAAYAPILLEQEHCLDNSFTETYRVIIQSQKELFNAGYNNESFDYSGEKWGGKYLKAPEIYYTIIQKCKDKLKRLGELSNSIYGIKTGANEFFYLDDETQSEWQIESEFLIPVFKSPRESKSILIDPSKLNLFLFNCNRNKNEIKGSNALKYIQWGEQSRRDKNGDEIGRFNQRASCSGRTNWYSVGERKISQGVFPKGFGDIFRIFENNSVVVDCRLYEIYSDEKDLILIMNSTLFIFFLEISARSGLGDGLIEFFVYELPHFLVPIVDISPYKNRKSILNREIKDILTELGFDKKIPIRNQTSNPFSDRKELDDIVFKGLGLTDVEQEEVYWSLAELVNQRLNKAASR